MRTNKAFSTSYVYMYEGFYKFESNVYTYTPKMHHFTLQSFKGSSNKHLPPQTILLQRNKRVGNVQGKSEGSAINY